MRRETQEALAAEINRMLETGTTTMAAGVMQNPVAEYTDPNRLADEHEFLRLVPIVAGRSSQLPNPKDFITIDIVGVPILLVRQNDDTLRAMLNVCRHRGSKVTFEPCGNRTVFSCPYHAWSYRSDGSLLSISHENDFGDVEHDELGLTELAVEERHGFIWVLPTPGKPIDVAAFLGAELDDELAGYGLEGFVVERSSTSEVATNWKVVIDGFLETYHLNILHRTTIGPHIRSNVAPFRSFGPHGCMTAVRTNFDKVRHDDLDSTNLTPYLVNAYQIFPNTVLVWSGVHLEAWLSFPGPLANDGAGVSTVTVHVLGAETHVQTEPEYFEKNWDVVKSTVLGEDFLVGAAIQLGFSSGAQTHVTFGRNEPGVQHFHQSLTNALQPTSP